MEDKLDDIYDEAHSAANRIDHVANAGPPIEIVTAFMDVGAIAHLTEAVEDQTEAITKLTQATIDAGR